MGQPGLVLNVEVGSPACEEGGGGGGIEDSWSLRSLPTQAILWFCVAENPASVCVYNSIIQEISSHLKILFTSTKQSSSS